MTVIYAITHIDSGKVYVGSAVDFSSRVRVHRHHLNEGTHHSPHLQAAWKRYGESAFTFTVLERVEDRFWLLAREQAWINRLRSADRHFGYNARPIAESNLGKSVSAGTKAKLRAANLGKKATPGKLEKMRGRVVSEATRAKRSESMKKAYAEGRHPGGWALRAGVPMSENHKRKIGEANRLRAKLKRGDA